MTYATINPATGETVQTHEDISDAALDAALQTAHDCFTNDWRLRSVAERAAVIKAAAEELRTNSAEYAGYVTGDMGKLIGTAEAEVGLSAAILDYYADRAEQFLAPQVLPEAPGAFVETEPIGVILGIEPWNFPYYQVVRVAGPQLMAGNTLVVKHAESVPECALALARLFEKAGAPIGLYTNIFASIDQVGSAIEDERIAGVTITGSERAGSSVAERAGRSLKKVVMELGGSDPLIVLDDADLEHAVGGAMFGRIFNTGQSCVGSKRIIIVGQERGAAFQEAFTAQMASLQVGDPTEPETTLGPLSSERALDLILDQIREAEDNGAQVLLGGRRVDRDGFYVEATVLTGIDAKNPAYTTEFFGPVASLYVVDTEDEAIELANATPFGLGASIFTGDTTRGRALAKRIDAGMVWINQPAWTGPELPFGGTKRSGFGRELSEAGFGEFGGLSAVGVLPRVTDRASTLLRRPRRRQVARPPDNHDFGLGCRPISPSWPVPATEQQKPRTTPNRKR
jgi:succinate-semialdehyde dehydrogenase/glutarate-semialdehyde dehydrogenase